MTCQATVYIACAWLALLLFTRFLNSIPVQRLLELTLLWILLWCIYYRRKNTENFHFEVTPAKMCDGGWYMWTSNPAKMKYCSSLTPEERTKYTCSEKSQLQGLYYGRPVFFEYTPMSDNNWENPILQDQTNDNHVNVL